MKKRILFLFLLTIYAPLLQAQVDTNILNAFQKEAQDQSTIRLLGMELIDGIGPRLTGTPQFQQANDWLVKTYSRWHITAENETYGKWKGWERGTSSGKMIYPRFQTLEVRQLAWSPASPKERPIEAEVIALPNLSDSISFQRWLPSVKGKVVLISQPRFSGRPEESWKANALEGDYQTYLKDIKQEDSLWQAQLKAMAITEKSVQKQLEKAGAVALLSSSWSGGWGSSRIFGTKTEQIPHFDLILEDYQLLMRFLSRGITPRVQLQAESKHLGEVAVQNTIARIESPSNPEEYVMLSAHLDSWDPATGATDNGTGTLLMMEVMRLLKKHYPNPKRTIMVGHWGGEEQGLLGSRSFVADHQDLMPKISVLFNQDNGTGRISWINGLGFLDAYDYFDRWMKYLPAENREAIKTHFPGSAGRPNSDYAAFLPYDVPSFFLISEGWDYGTYTWHNNYDSYDKIVWSELERNAVTIATFVYLACEEPEMFSRKKAQLPLNIKTGKRQEWPKAKPVERNSDFYFK